MQNRLYEGDNLSVLKQIQSEFEDSIDLVYIDPPYNTKNRFVYNDKQANWYDFMYPRIEAVYPLLSDYGVIAVSINDQSLIDLRMILDKIFTPQRFISQIVVVVTPGGNSFSKQVRKCHEYLVLYSKKDLPTNYLSVSLTEKRFKQRYPRMIGGKHFGLEQLRKATRRHNKDTKPTLYFPIYAKRTSNQDDGDVLPVSIDRTSEFDIEIYPDWSDGFAGCWCWSRETVRKRSDDLIARKNKTGQWMVYQIKRPKLNETEQVISVWNGTEFMSATGQKEFNSLFKDFDVSGPIFDYPKPLELIRQVVRMATHQDSIILDFFAGSGTTGQAVMDVNKEDGGNRKFILIQQREKIQHKHPAYKAGYRYITDITEERLRRAYPDEGFKTIISKT